MSPVGAAFKMESCILPIVSFVLSLLRRSGGCMSRACCGAASSRRCGAYMSAACILGGVVAARACLFCLLLFLFFSVAVRPVLFCLPWFVLPALSLFFLSLSLSLSLLLSLSPCLSSGIGPNIIKRDAWTQTLERGASFLVFVNWMFCRFLVLSWVVDCCYDDFVFGFCMIYCDSFF